MDNNVLKGIIKNVNNIIEIRKIAQKENVDFKTAKIMFNDGKNDIEISTAKKIKEIADKYKMPSNIIQRVILDNNDSNIEEWHIYYEIYKTNDIINQNEEIKKIGQYYNYIESIHNLLKYGLSIEDADKLLQIKINAYSKIHNVSKLVATLKVAYKIEKNEAIKYAEILDFFEKENRRPSHNMAKNLREYLWSSNVFKKKTIRGITIISKTEEGLQKLENIINETFIKGKENFTKELEKASNNESLFVTDYSYDITSCNYNSLALIYLNTNRLEQNEPVSVFFHEASHFLDNPASLDNDIKHYSILEPKVREIFEKIRTEINKTPINSIIKNQNIPLSIRKFIQDTSSKKNLGLYAKGIRYLLPKVEINKKEIKYISSQEKLANEFINDERINQKWKAEIEKKYFLYSKEDRDLFYRQKLNYEKQKYLDLIIAIYDIYDGLSNGNLYSHLYIPGHGKKYYSIENNDIVEFFANIGEIYNSGGKEILEFEFGQNLANEMLQIYNDIIRNKEANLQIEKSENEVQVFNKENSQKSIEIHEATAEELAKDLDLDLNLDDEQQINTRRKKINILKSIKDYIKKMPNTNQKNNHQR